MAQRNKENTTSNQQKLDLMLDEYLRLNETMQRKNYSNDTHYMCTKYDLFGEFMFKLYGYNSKPQIVPDQQYISTQEPTLYRGKNADFLANILCDDSYHLCSLYHGTGIYSTKDEQVAKIYENRSHNGTTLNFKIDGKIADRKLIKQVSEIWGGYATKYDIQDIKAEFPEIAKKCEEIFKFLNTLPTTNRPEDVHRYQMKSWFTEEFFTANPAYIAAYLGFDAVSINNYDGEEEIIVLNRGKMVVSLSEYNRICAASKRYKHCVKTEEDLCAAPEAM